MTYNISFDICATAVTAIALYTILFRRDLQRASNRVLLVMLIMHFISEVLDIWSSYVNSYPQTCSLLLRDFTNYTFLAIHTSEACVFLCYLLTQLGMWKSLKKWQKALMILPEILLILLPLALNPFLRCTFYYDQQNVYRHGPLMPPLYIGGVLYMFLCIFLVARKRERLTFRQRRAALALLFLSAVPILIQSLFMQHQLIELFFQSLGLYGYILTVENVDECYHPVTHTRNRHALIRDLAPYFMNQISVCAVIIKLSQIEYLRISSIGSDVFHGLRLTVADWLLSISGYTNFYDCERGIFTILVPDQSSRQKTRTRKMIRSGKYSAEKLCAMIEERFTKEWKYQDYDALFPVQVSMIRIPEDMQSIEQFLQLISLPYVHTKSGVVYADGSELLRQFCQMEDEGTQALPAELQESLDNFLSGIAKLTPAERNIADLYINGYEIADIPDKAFISMNTVKKHNKNIYRKLGIGSRDELMLYVDLFERCGKIDDLYR